MRRADRMIKMVHFLRSRRRAVTAKRIADEFGICTRTVYRDIQDLMDTGTPITGEAGVGYMIDKQYYLPPISFDTDELEAICLGISMVRQWTDEKFADKANDAYEKIHAVLPEKLQGEIQQLTTYAMPAEPSLSSTVSFSQLRECIREQRKIRIEYSDDKKKPTSRSLWPLALVFCSPVWLLASWCEKRGDFRHFRLDRIQAIHFGDERFDNDPDKDLSAYLAKPEACNPNV